MSKCECHVHGNTLRPMERTVTHWDGYEEFLSLSDGCSACLEEYQREVQRPPAGTGDEYFDFYPLGGMHSDADW